MHDGTCSESIAKRAKWTPKGQQMCKFCADVRDGPLTEGPASSSPQIEERVRALEALVENLQQAQSSSATLVENILQQLVEQQARSSSWRAGEKDKCRRCGGAALSGAGPADTPAEGCGRDREEVAVVPSPCDSGRREAVVRPEAELAEIDSPPIIGTCVLCDGRGIVGNRCTRCEDSGMIYEALSERSADDSRSSERSDPGDLEEGPRHTGRQEDAAETPELEPPCVRREDTEVASPRECSELSRCDSAGGQERCGEPGPWPAARQEAEGDARGARRPAAAAG